MAFVRVKRRYDEDPFNSIVVSHKKLKTTGTNVSKDCVFQFATTLKTEVSLYVQRFNIFIIKFESTILFLINV